MHNVLTDSGPAVPVMLGDKELTTYKKTVMLTHTNVTENHRKGKKSEQVPGGALGTLISHGPSMIAGS